MAEDNPNPPITVAVSQSNGSLDSQGDFKSDLNKLFSEATKYTVLVLFILYAVGFLIWHSFLATYCVSSVGFLQTEYLSAALCYFWIAVSFATPPVVLLERLVKKNNPHSLPWLLYVWYLVSIKLVDTFFPEAGGSKYVFRYTMAGVLILVAYILTMLALKKKYSGNKTFKTLWNFDFFSVFVFGYIITFVLSHKDVDDIFVGYTIFIYFSLVGISGKDIRKAWKVSDYKLRIVLLTLASFVFLSNVEYFGANQFGKIPRQVGGGRPEIAYVKFDKEHSEMPISLGIPICATSFISPNFCGPVNLLLRTEKELIFLIPNEASLPSTLTNQIIINTPTNIVESVVTNKTYIYSTNGNYITVTIPITYNVITNYLSLALQININNTKMTAKQVRADIVESIIFSR